jgi:membrane-associated phospholipid phosphatase
MPLPSCSEQLCGRLRPDFLWRTGSEVLDGRRSFPSGHSSSAYAICWYGAFYILWSLHWRYSQAWQVGAAWMSSMEASS